MGFVAFQVINTITCFGACYEHILPKLSKALILLNAISVRVVVITLFAMSSTRTSAKDFIKVVNTSVWPDGVAFIIGSNGVNWCFLRLDVRHTPGRRNPLTWHKHAKSFDLAYSYCIS